MLEVEDVEDVACTVDDMGVRGNGVRKGWNQDSDIQGLMGDAKVVDIPPRQGTGLRHYLVRAQVKRSAGSQTSKSSQQPSSICKLRYHINHKSIE
jgi:hypothetical protein